MENLEICFNKFNQKINVIKESDVEMIQNHVKNIKNENLRLIGEIKRLTFIIENYINEKDMNDIEEVKEILNKKVKVESKEVKTKKKIKEKLDFSKKNIQKFLKKWNEGYTTFEITENYKRINVDIRNTKKKRFKL